LIELQIAEIISPSLLDSQTNRLLPFCFAYQPLTAMFVFNNLKYD